MAQDRYRHTAGAVSNLHLHLVWCPKYRRPVLVGPVASRLRELLEQKAAALEVTVAGLEVMPDHVHLLVSVPPVNAPQFYANQFKGFTSRVLRQEFGHLKSSLPSLWSRSYFVGSAGTVTAATIKRYIASQQERG
jgi:putative transposase